MQVMSLSRINLKKILLALTIFGALPLKNIFTLL